MRSYRISTFKLKKKIKLELKNGDLMQWLDKAYLVDVYMDNHHEQLLCCVTKFDVYTVVLEEVVTNLQSGYWLEELDYEV